MKEKNHFCEYEVAGRLVFCRICGELYKFGSLKRLPHYVNLPNSTPKTI